MVKNLMSIKNGLQEQGGFVSNSLHQGMIALMNQTIEQFNQQMKILLEGNLELQRQTQIKCLLVTR